MNNACIYLVCMNVCMYVSMSMLLDDVHVLATVAIARSRSSAYRAADMARIEKESDTKSWSSRLHNTTLVTTSANGFCSRTSSPIAEAFTLPAAVTNWNMA